MNERVYGFVINVNAYGATVRLESGELASAPAGDVEAHRVDYERGMSAREALAFVMHPRARRPMVTIVPRIDEPELDAQIAHYLEEHAGVGKRRRRRPGARAPLPYRRRSALAHTLSKHYAIISIGTNSTACCSPIWSPSVPHVDLARSIGTRIGEGLRESGELGDEPMRRTFDAMRRTLRAVRGHYVRLFAIATSALRRASNGDAFTARVQDDARRAVAHTFGR